ncbi:MAG: hypothetical protein KH355_02260 [Clostridiales bacterium]|nr:hypothetical protein [Clostridiales bacterium]
MKDKKINILIILVCVVVIGTVIITKITKKEEKKTGAEQNTVTLENKEVTYDEGVDMEQFLNGNTLKNDTGTDDEGAYDNVDSIIKVEDDPTNPIFTTGMEDITRSLPSMIEAQVRKQDIDLGLNTTLTVHPEPMTFKEIGDTISFEMFFDELVDLIHIEYNLKTGEMTVLIYPREKENLKKYGWDKVLEEKYNISVD